MSEQKQNPAWQRSVTIGIMALGFASGTTDVMSYVQLGHVFTSATTGTNALFALALARRKWIPLAHAAAALGGFIIGGLIAAKIHGRRPTEEVRAADLRNLFAFEMMLLAAFLIAWEVLSHPLPHGAVYGLLLVSGAAMGVQNVAARQIEVPGVNTVVLNNTMTSIIVSFASPRRSVTKSSPPGKNVMRQSGVWACYLLGALIQGFVATHLKMGTGAFPLAAVILVVGLFYRLGRSPSMVKDETAKAEAAKASKPPVIVLPPSRMRPVGPARTGSLFMKAAMGTLPVLGAASAALMAYRTVQRLIFGPSGAGME